MTVNSKAAVFEEIERHKDNIYVVQQELTKVVPQHTHTQAHILVVQNGVATMNVERSAFYIPYGYFVWIPSGKSHRISFEEKSIHVLNIYYPKNFSTGGFYEEVGIYPMSSLLYHTLEYVQGRTADYTPKDWIYELLATANHILPHIIPKRRSQLWLPTSDNPMTTKILEKIHSKYHTPITAQEIADNVGISVRTLSRYMRSELNVSFVQYVRKYRVVMAIKKMVKNEESITNIAYSVGYDSLTAFSNSFYKVTGHRPSHFLKLI